MSDEFIPSTFKPRSYEERKRAEEEARKRNNQSTASSYKLRGRATGHAKQQHWKGPDSTGPTRDMQPVKLQLKGQPKGEPCNVVSLSEYKQEKHEEKKQ